MKKIIALSIVLAAGLALAVDYSESDRMRKDGPLIQILNGSPIRVAIIATDGGIAANSCTSPAGAFDAGLGDFLMVQCNYDHYVRTGTCSTAATADSMKLLADEKFYTMLRVDEMAVSAMPTDGGLTGTCRVFHLR